MAILRIKDENGNIIDIPAIKGDPYELTEADKTEIKDAVLTEVKRVFYCDSYFDVSTTQKEFYKDEIYPQDIDIRINDYIISDGAVYITIKETPNYWRANKLVDISPMPTVTTDDNGKFLRVVDGAWSAVAIENAEGVGF